MIQVFMKNNPPYDSGHLPILLSASRIGEIDNTLPRLMHRHDDFIELLLITEGYGTYIVDNKTYAVGTGDLIICDSGVLHDEVPENNRFIMRYNLALTNVRHATLGLNRLIMPNSSPIIKTENRFSTLLSLFSETFNLLYSQAPGSGQTAQFTVLAAYSIIVNEFLKPDTNKGSSELIKNNSKLQLAHAIRDFLDIHYAEDITLDLVASSFSYSKYYVAHLFKKMTGYSVLEYVNRRRIGEAQTLLISTSLSITEIMSKVGFNSLPAFGKSFRKAVGIAPSTYREIYVGVK